MCPSTYIFLCVWAWLKLLEPWNLFAQLLFVFGAMSQLGPFEVGQIKAHLHHGLKGAAIVELLKKTGWEVAVVEHSCLFCN